MAGKISRREIGEYLGRFQKIASGFSEYDTFKLVELFCGGRSKLTDASEIRNYWANFIKEKENSKESWDINFYMHVPFCAQKCTYCQYPSKVLRNKEETGLYVKNIIGQMEFFSDTFKNVRFKKISIGGGTPDILDEKQLERIMGAMFRLFRFKDDYVREVEFHPSFSTREKIKIFKKYGFNRISFGIQSFKKETLESSNRVFGNIKKYKESLKNSIAWSQQEGFEYINVDLLMGFMEESYEELEKNLEEVMRLGPTQVEIYLMKVPSPAYLRRHSKGDRNLFLGNMEKVRKVFLERYPSLAGKYGYYMTTPWQESIEETKDAMIHLWPHYVLAKKEKKGTWKKSGKGFGLFGHYYCFGIGQYSVSSIFGKYGAFQKESFSPTKPIYEITKLDMEYEIKKYLFSALEASGKICLSEFKKIFGIDFLDKFKNPIAALMEIGKIKIGDDFVIFLAEDKRELFVHSMFFLLKTPKISQAR